MTDLQAEKKLVLNYFSEIDSCDIESLTEVISKYASEDFSMKCTHPFNELGSADIVANNLWRPIKDSFSPIQRRLDIFYAGINSLDKNEGKWISSMGHFMGVFNKSFLGLKPNCKSILLRLSLIHI